MKPKHIGIRIRQCLELAAASNCPRRKFGALLLDPERNTILADGYNGGPRGGGDFCAGDWCIRDGMKPDEFVIEVLPAGTRGGSCLTQLVHLPKTGGRRVIKVDYAEEFDDLFHGRNPALEALRDELCAKHPPVQSGTRMEIGCHHAEQNVICNAAASTVSCRGAWLILTGEPCAMCSKMIHHAGIVKVIVVAEGYAGENGIEYLRTHGVEVEYAEGPRDPRLA